MKNNPPSERSVTVGRDMLGNVVVTGDGNEVNVTLIVADRRLLGRVRSSATPDDPKINPYQGLDAFYETNAAFFFGRTKLIRRAWLLFQQLQRGHMPRILAVVGASGSGKSSLVRAGLLPELAREPMAGLESPNVLVLRPGFAPLDQLSKVLARLPSMVATSDRDLRLSSEAGTFNGLHRLLSDASIGSRARFVVVVDQFEELFTECTDAEARTAFLQNLSLAASHADGLVSVILTVRSDFAAAVQSPPSFASAVREGRLIVQGMDREELNEAVTRPAIKLGFPWPLTLVESLVGQVEGRSGALPLLGFALKQLWSSHVAGDLEEASWSTRLVEDFLVETANALFETTGNGGNRRNNQRIIRRALLAMVQLGDGTPDTRRVARLSEFLANGEDTEHLRRVLAPFTAPETRLVTASEEDDEPTFELTHESLITSWNRLNTWLGNVPDKVDAERIRAGLRIRKKLTTAARDWRMGRGSVWRPPELDQINWLEQQMDLEFTKDEREFADDSKKEWNHHLEEQRSKERRIRILLRATRVLSVAAMLFAIYLAFLWRDARHQRDEARLQRDLAQIQRLADLSNTALHSEPTYATLLAIEACKVTAVPTTTALQALRNALSELDGARVNSVPQKNILAISPNGKFVASEGNYNFRLTIQEIVGAKTTQVLAQTGNHYEAVRFSDSNAIVATDYDGKITYWDLAQTPAIAFELDKGRDISAAPTPQFIDIVALSGSGINIAASLPHHSVHIWTRVPGGPFRSLEIPIAGTVTALDVSDLPSDSNSVRIAVGYTENNLAHLALYEASGGHAPRLEYNRALTGTPINALLLGPSDHLFWGDGSGKIFGIQWRQDRGQPLNPLATHSAAVTVLAYREPYLLSGGADGFVTVIEHSGDGYQEVRKMHLQDSPIRALAPQANELILTLGADHVLRQVAVGGTSYPVLLYGDSQKQQGFADHARSITFSPDDRLLAATRDSFVDVWDADAFGRAPQAVGPFSKPPIAVAFGSHGLSLISANTDGDIEITDLRDFHRSLLGTLSGLRKLVFSPQTEEVFASNGHQIAKWNLKAGAQRTIVYEIDPAHQEEWIDLSSEGRWFLRDTSIYEMDQPKMPKWILQHPGGPGGLSVNRQGMWAVMAQYMWDLRSARRSQSSIQPTTRISRGGIPPYGFDSSGEYLLSTDYVSSFDPNDPREDVVLSHIFADPLRDEGLVLARIPPATELLFSPKANWAAASGRDGAVHVWPLHFEDLYEMAQSAAGRNMTLEEWQRAEPSEPYRKTFDKLTVSATVIGTLISSSKSLIGDRQQLYKSLTLWSIELGDPAASREVCLNGALLGLAKQVLPACFAAEVKSNRNPIAVDTTAIALARSGDLKGARERFQYFLDWAANKPGIRARAAARENWVKDLERHRAPDDAEFSKVLSEGWWEDGWPPE